MSSNELEYGSATSVITTGNAAWSNLGNIYSEDGTNEASVTLLNGQTSDTIRLTGFGFTDPADDNVVVGIYVYVRCRVGSGNSCTLNHNIYDATNGVSPTQYTDAVTQTTLGFEYAGGNSLLWGNTIITAADVKASTFGYEFSVTNNSGSTETFYIDAVRVYCYYEKHPVIESIQTTTPATGTSHAMTAPTGITAGETLLLLVATDDNENGRNRISISSGGTGWRKLFEHGHSGPQCRIAGFIKMRASGSEGTVTINSTSNCAAIGHYMRISNTLFIPIQEIGEPNYIINANTVNTPTSPTLESNNKAGLQLAFCAADAAPGPVSVSGTGWSEETEANNSTFLGSCIASRKNNGTATLYNPTFTQTTSEETLAVVMNFASPDAQYYYTGEFPYTHYRRAKITIDHTKVSNTLTDFPVMITQDDLPGNAIDSNASHEIYDSSGRDVFFTSDPQGENLIPHHIIDCFKTTLSDSWKFHCYVSVPTLSSSADTIIYMWWRGTVTSNWGPWWASQVWKDYIFVAMAGGDVDSAPQIRDDSSPYNRAFNDVGTNSWTTNGSPWHENGMSENLGGSDDYFRHYHEGGFDFTTGNWTLQAWAKPDTTGSNQMVACVQNDSTNYSGTIGGFAITREQNSYWGMLSGGNTNNWTANKKSTVTCGPNEVSPSSGVQLGWALLHAEYNAGAGNTIYVNGTGYTGGDTQSWLISTKDSNFTIGCNAYDLGGPAYDFDGNVLDVRLREGVLPTGWIATEWANQKNDGTFLTVEMAGSACWEQEGFRWRNDDGTEATATWMDAQDTNVTGPRSIRKRIRFVLNNEAINDPLQEKFKIQVRRVGDVAWKDLD